MNTLTAVLFDLDGTLIDSAADLGAALNAVLLAEACRPLTLQQIRPHVSNGSHALIELGFSSRGGVEHERHRQQLLQIYQQFPCVQTTCFPGILASLGYLAARGIPWGIVTNKPGYLTAPILSKLRLDSRAGCVVCGDTLEHSKPHPQPLLQAAQTLGVRPQHCLYIGDARRDIEAGKNAGMWTGVATYGYIPPHQDPAQWGADWVVSSSTALPAVLTGMLG